MKKRIQKIGHTSWRVAKKVHHHVMHQPHIYFYENWKWYKWWHEQDYHQHVHYVAMICGIILAVYMVMIDTITSEVSFFN